MNDFVNAGPGAEDTAPAVAADPSATTSRPPIRRAARLAGVIGAAARRVVGAGDRVTATPAARQDLAGWLLFDTPAGTLALGAHQVDGAIMEWPASPAPQNVPNLLRAVSALEPLLCEIEDLTGLTLEPRGFAAGAPDLRMRLQVYDSAGAARHDLWFAAGESLVAGLPEVAPAAAMVACVLWLEGPLAPEVELALLAPGDVIPLQGAVVPSALAGPGGCRVPGVVAAAGRRFVAAAAARAQPMDRREPGAVRLRVRTGPILLERARWESLGAGDCLCLPPEAAQRALLRTGAGLLAAGRLSAIGGLFGFVVDRLETRA